MTVVDLAGIRTPSVSAGPIASIDNIPAELRKRPQWVAWSMESRKAGGKPTKVPKNPNTGGNAMADNPKTWGTFDAARAVAAREDWSGIGYEFSIDDPFAGIQLADVGAEMRMLA